MTQPEAPAPDPDPSPPGPAPFGDDPLEERVIGSRLIHRGRYMEFRVDTIERPDGSRGTRDVVGHPGAVAVLALDADGRLLLVRQWRIPAGAALLEIPAGTLDVHDGTTEDPDVAARRELEEETGTRATTWRKLAAFWTAPGFASELMHLYLATGIGGVGADDDRLAPDEDERLELRHVRLDDALGLVERGDIRDAKSILGILWLDRLRQAGAVAELAPAMPPAAPAAPAGPTGPTALAAPGQAPPAPGSDPSAIRLSYGFTPLTFARANGVFVRHQRSSQVLGSVSIVGTIANLLTFQDPVLAAVTLVLGVGLLTGWFVVPFVWFSFRRKAAMFSRLDASIDDAGLASNWPAGGGAVAWSGIERIDHHGGWFMVRTAAGTAWPIPDRAFDAGGLAAFQRLALRHGHTLDGHRVDPAPG